MLTRSNTCDQVNLENLEALQTPTTSDHYLISFTCTTAPDRTSSRVQKSGRKIDEIDMNSFKRDILSSDLNCPDKFADCETAVGIYNQTLTKILDEHAPVVKYSVNPDQSKWINSECQDARRKRRKAERDNQRLKAPPKVGSLHFRATNIVLSVQMLCCAKTPCWTSAQHFRAKTQCRTSALHFRATNAVSDLSIAFSRNKRSVGPQHCIFVRNCSVEPQHLSRENAVSDLSTAFSRENAVSDLSTTFSC